VPCLWRSLSSSSSGHPNKTPESSLLTWSCALIFWPRIFLFAIGQSQQSLTPLESFLALHFGLLLAFLAVGLVVNVRNAFTRVSSCSPYSNLNNRVILLTLTNTQIPSSVPVPARADKEPPAHPLVVPIVSFALLSAFLSYNTTGAGSLPKVYSACTGLVGIWGLWVVSGFFEWYHR
jgi:hypothetical protein